MAGMVRLRNDCSSSVESCHYSTTGVVYYTKRHPNKFWCIYNLLMLNLIVSPAIREKLLTKHSVKEGEVTECFYNRVGSYLEDDEEDHRTDPPSYWFISETNCGRRLKVVFVAKDGNVYLKTAYDANQKSESIYTKLSQPQE